MPAEQTNSKGTGSPESLPAPEATDTPLGRSGKGVESVIDYLKQVQDVIIGADESGYVVTDPDPESPAQG